MKLFKTLFSGCVILATAVGVWAQDDYVRGRDPQADAIRDMQIGMAGLKQATQVRFYDSKQYLLSLLLCFHSTLSYCYTFINYIRQDPVLLAQLMQDLQVKL